MVGQQIGEEATFMRIVVFGPTGMVGSRIAAELSARGHEVIGASRSTGTDIADPTTVAAALSGADGAVCAVSAREGDFTLADGARSLVEGMRQAGLTRLVVVGGAGSLEVAPGVRLMDSPEFPEAYMAEAAQAADALAFYRGVTDLDWTYVSPAAYIHPGERTGRYRLGGDQMLVDDQGNSEISAEDYAIAIADLLEGAGHPRERVSAAW
jgi:putative NADH-flavin reductase